MTGLFRRINLLYLSLPFLGWGLWTVFTQVNHSAHSFYGFAENKETSINLDHDLLVHKIHVKPGQFVQKGSLLLEVSRTELEYRLNELSNNIAELQSKDQWRVADLRGQIERLRAEKAEKAASYLSQIQVAEAELALQRSLLQQLKSVQLPDSLSFQGSPVFTKVQALRNEMRLALLPYDREIDQLLQDIQLAGLPDQAQINRYRKDLELTRKEAEKLSIFAPSDGLIGTLHCKEGENLEAFSSLISFYEQNPNMVVAYVHESLSLEVQVGDSVQVTSSLHPAETSPGRISGLGHRIVEIPERLRKIPEIRTYGREVLIEIPTPNQFLQKEKVILQHLR